MTRFSKDPFGGLDYTQFASWKKVVLPNGEVYYEIPGHPGYVYDPVYSNATGRVIIRANPKGQIDAQAEEQRKQQDAERQQKELLEQQKFNQSPLGQIMPIAASTGGIIAAHQLIPTAADPIKEALAEQIRRETAAKFGQEVASQGTQQVANAAAEGATSAAMQQGATAMTETGAQQGLSMIPGLGGESSVGAVAPETGFLANAASLGPGPLAAIIAGTVMGGKAGWDMLHGKKANPIGRGILGIATGGLSEIANATGVFGHKSTRDIARGHTSDLLDRVKDDSISTDYITGMREQYNSGPPDPDNPYFNGKYGSFDEYKAAGLNAGDLSGVYGNLDTFEDWGRISQDERERRTQALIDADLYESDHGEVVITDPEKAREIIAALNKEKAKQDDFATAAAQGAGAGNRLPGGR
jgi:hypothetical protein